MNKFLIRMLLLGVVTSPSLADTEKTWVYPNQAIPGDSIIPFTIGEGNDYDINLLEPHWFMLKNETAVISEQIKRDPLLVQEGSRLGYWGPKLNEYNSQRYFNTTVGLILQASFQRALSISKEEVYTYVNTLKQKNISFNESNFVEDGLPVGLLYLYNNLDKKTIVASLVTEALSPLAISYHTSKLRHFYKGSDEIRQCNNLYTLPPVSVKWDEIHSNTSSIDSLERQLQEKQVLINHASAVKAQSFNRMNYLKSELELAAECGRYAISGIESGASDVNLDCSEAFVASVNAKMSSNILENWNKLLNSFGAHPNGLLNAISEAKERLTLHEAALYSRNKGVLSLEFNESDINLQILSAEENLEKLRQSAVEVSQSLPSLKEQLALLNIEFTSLKSDQKDFLTLSYSEVLSEDEAQRLDDLTLSAVSRDSKESDLKANIESLESEILAVEEQLELLRTQELFLESSVESFKLQLEALTAGVTSDILSQSPEDLEVEIERLKEVVKALEAENNNASVVIETTSAYTDILLADFNEAEANYENSTQRLSQLQIELDEFMVSYDSNRGNFVEIREKGIEEVKDYIGEDGTMSWFLAQNDSACENDDADAIYLSRKKVSAETSITELSASKWGLFNTDMDLYKETISSGELLNLRRHIHNTVLKVGEHANFTSQFLIGNHNNCVNNSVTNAMKSIYSLWSTGGDREGFCNYENEDVNSYEKSLNELLSFEESFLNQVLPLSDYNSDSALKERLALESLLKISNNLIYEGSVFSDSDKKDIIKSLVNLLSVDYQKLDLVDQVANESLEIRLADEAPGVELMTDKVLRVGEVYKVMTTGRVELYESPLLDGVSSSAEFLSFGDEVELLDISYDESKLSSASNWVKVKVPSYNNSVFWMPAWSLGYDKMINEAGEFYKTVDLNLCPLNTLVTEITNFQQNDFRVTRFLQELQFTEGADDSSILTINWSLNNSNRIAATTPTSTGTVHIACEIFKKPGKTGISSQAIEESYLDKNGLNYQTALAISVVEARKITDAKGRFYYLPVEDTPGFIPVWLQTRNATRPRIVLGEGLTENGSIKRGAE